MESTTCKKHFLKEQSRADSFQNTPEALLFLTVPLQPVNLKEGNGLLASQRALSDLAKKNTGCPGGSEFQASNEKYEV